MTLIESEQKHFIWSVWLIWDKNRKEKAMCEKYRYRYKRPWWHFLYLEMISSIRIVLFDVPKKAGNQTRTSYFCHSDLCEIVCACVRDLQSLCTILNVFLPATDLSQINRLLWCSVQQHQKKKHQLWNHALSEISSTFYFESSILDTIVFTYIIIFYFEIHRMQAHTYLKRLSPLERILGIANKIAFEGSFGGPNFRIFASATTASGIYYIDVPSF